MAKFARKAIFPTKDNLIGLLASEILSYKKRLLIYQDIIMVTEEIYCK